MNAYHESPLLQWQARQPDSEYRQTIQSGSSDSLWQFPAWSDEVTSITVGQSLHIILMFWLCFPEISHW